MKYTFLFFIYYLLTSVSFGQESIFKKYEQQSLINDIDSLISTIKKTHQNPFTYCSKSDLSLAVKNAKSQIKDSLNAYEFAEITAQLLSTLRDSHTYLNYAGLKKKYQMEGGRTVGFQIAKINDNYIIVKDKNALISIGSILDTINGFDMDYLFNKVNNYSIFEGNSKNANLKITEAIFSSSLGYVIPLLDQNKLVVRNGYEVENILYPAKQIPSQKKRQKKTKSAPFTLEIDSISKGELAVIKISSFSAKGNRSFNRFLRRSFKTIKKDNIKYVAIDLRNNLGGQIIRTDILMSYLTEDASYIPSNIIAKQSALSKQMYRSKINGFMFLFLKMSPFKSESLKNFVTQVKMKEGEVDTLYYKEPNPYFSKKHNFKGKSFLMINGMSGSASVLFASAYRDEIINGTIIGEPCLGPRSGTWGNPAKYVLPNSGLQVFISTIRTNIDNSFVSDDIEFTPDFIIPRTIDTIKIETDDYLTFIREQLIKQGNHK